MKLSKKDKEYLISIGVPETNFLQIEEAMSCTKYEVNGKKISRKAAIEYLGKETYLSGINRSAFHWTAMREGVYFDSSALFRE